MFSVTSRAPDGAVLYGSLTYTPPPALLLGVDTSNADLAHDLGDYPKMTYHRVFSPTAWPNWTSGKLATLPLSVTPHCSCDGPWVPEDFRAWCAKATRPVYATWKHEPMKKVSPTDYQHNSAEMAAIAAEYPLILGTGPVLIRFWVDDARGDPSLWWFAGASFWGVDCYNGLDDRYRPPGEMFGTAVELGHGYGVPVLIPEWGVERLAFDASGEQRAQVLRDSVTYLRSTRVVAAGWWNVAGSPSRLPAGPEKATLQTLVDQQGTL